MSRVVAIIFGLVLLAGLAFLFAPDLFTRTYAYDQFVCMGCGLKRVEDARTLARIVYHRRVTFEESAISRALKVNSCPHSWLKYRFGHTSKRPFLSIHADGGCPSQTLSFLLYDNLFAQELSHMENPSKTWAALVSGLNASRALDESLATWRIDSDRGGFSAWAATNGF